MIFDWHVRCEHVVYSWHYSWIELSPGNLMCKRSIQTWKKPSEGKKGLCIRNVKQMPNNSCTFHHRNCMLILRVVWFMLTWELFAFCSSSNCMINTVPVDTGLLRMTPASSISCRSAMDSICCGYVDFCDSFATVRIQCHVIQWITKIYVLRFPVLWYLYHDRGCSSISIHMCRYSSSNNCWYLACSHCSLSFSLVWCSCLCLWRCQAHGTWCSLYPFGNTLGLWQYECSGGHEIHGESGEE